MSAVEAHPLGSYEQRQVLCDAFARLLIDRADDGTEPPAETHPYDMFDILIRRFLPEDYPENNPNIDHSGPPEIPYAQMATLARSFPAVLSDLVEREFITDEDRSATMFELGYEIEQAA